MTWRSGRCGDVPEETPLQDEQVLGRGLVGEIFENPMVSFPEAQQDVPLEFFPVAGDFQKIVRGAGDFTVSLAGVFPLIPDGDGTPVPGDRSGVIEVDSAVVGLTMRIETRRSIGG